MLLKWLRAMVEIKTEKRGNDVWRLKTCLSHFMILLKISKNCILLPLSISFFSISLKNIFK